MKTTGTVIIGFVLGFLSAAAIVILVPVRNDVTITHTETRTVSVIAEKQKCNKAGGTFRINSDYFSYRPVEMMCVLQASPKVLFDYTLSSESN